MKEPFVLTEEQIAARDTFKSLPRRKHKTPKIGHASYKHRDQTPVRPSHQAFVNANVNRQKKPYTQILDEAIARAKGSKP